jgi:hypothetical protein
MGVRYAEMERGQRSDSTVFMWASHSDRVTLRDHVGLHDVLNMTQRVIEASRSQRRRFNGER